MSPPGGTADKLGNAYEGLWAMRLLLEIVEGKADYLHPESLKPEESLGVEFTLGRPDGRCEYWSCKRQTSNTSGWSLSHLTTQDSKNKRSILGDLLVHVERQPNNCSVFASMDRPRELHELCEHAADLNTFEDRLKLNKPLRDNFQKYIVNGCCTGDRIRAIRFLQRLEVKGIDHDQLRDVVDTKIGWLFFHENGINPIGFCGHLAQLLIDQLNLHRPISQGDILNSLAPHGFGLRDWARDKTTREKVAALREQFVERRSNRYINKNFIPVATDNQLLDGHNHPVSKMALIVGEAGAGKSSSLASYVERLHNADIPVLPLSFDEIPEGLLTTERFGRALDLPVSPVGVLAGLAKDRTSALVVDQLDAISLTSGKRTDLWNLFDQLRKEVDGTPNVHLIVGCREFDLENDPRLKTLKRPESKFTVGRLRSLSTEQVNTALENAGIDPSTISSATKEIVCVPIYLSMFIELSSEYRPSAVTIDRLFDAFWRNKQARVGERIGRPAEWIKVIDALCGWCSQRQELSAPEYVLDEFPSDAAAMTSEHVLVHTQKRYRFFHDLFFDYAFARRFAARDERLLDVLLGGEQHLFRRAQVRAVLAFLRQRDKNAYLTELESMLLHDRIRFHLKRSALVELYNIPDPTEAEWRILQKLGAKSVDLRREHVNSTASTSAAWFDIADRTHFFDEGLASGNDEREAEIIELLRAPVVLQTRSQRVAAILKRHRKPSERWNAYLVRICRTGEIHHDRNIFDIFLGLIDDGTLDSLHSTGEREWLGMLWKANDANPIYSCEAVAHWFDRRVTTRGPRAESNVRDDWFDGTSIEKYWIGAISSKAPAPFVEWLLPRVAKLVEETAVVETDNLAKDPIWESRHYDDDHRYTVAEEILSGLANSMELLASTDPDALDRSVGPYMDRPHDTIAYLLLRAWTANPPRYADRIMDYCTADPRRLRVGYRGYLINFVSRKALECATSLCTSENRIAVENAILSLQSVWTPKSARFRDRTQLELLDGVGDTHMGEAARARLLELRAAFPGYQPGTPGRTTIEFQPRPMSHSDLDSLSDEALLNAMQEGRLPWDLETHVQSEPTRYSSFAIERMTDDLLPRYFDGILDGVSKARSDVGHALIEMDAVVALLRRVHRIPSKPCGQHFAWFIERWPESHWPEDIVEALAWYAVHDPDPDPNEIGDPESIGINSTRGWAAYAIAHLLFVRRELYSNLKNAIHSLIHDPSLAIRACTVEVLAAMLNIDPDQAITWFLETVENDREMLSTHRIYRFLHYASHQDYERLQPVLLAMLKVDQPDRVQELAARII